VQSVRRNPRHAGILNLKNFEIASGAAIATCKTRNSPEKWPDSTLSATRRRITRKKLMPATSIHLGFSEAQALL
jgi:hypothetical protein